MLNLKCHQCNARDQYSRLGDINSKAVIDTTRVLETHGRLVRFAEDAFWRGLVSDQAFQVFLGSARMPCMEASIPARP